MTKPQFLAAILPRIKETRAKGFSYAKMAQMISLKSGVEFTANEVKKTS
jgi:intein-encoded DNA endonuclease-like protein